ncbi:MAG: sulfate reduction electron transfer complex DsrMKJOP subunit DsrP [Planctomycetota bacterium]|jgi:molybdopterin-containing oxidoreductase family membrane subunit
MIEKALTGTKRYWIWILFLLGVMGVGLVCYLKQFAEGLTITGLSRDVPWGFYIAQFTFLVGVAASAVMVVLPYYLHNYKAFGKLAVLGEFLAISAVLMCVLFLFVDLGNPVRVVNIILHPTPNSLMFWDMLVLNGYLVLNIVISRATFSAERKGIAPPSWVKPLVILSIPTAISIHTVTAFLYSGLAARPFWMTAILAPRFLASAFASGPAILILICMIVRRLTSFDPGREAIRKLGQIVAYAMATNVFFLLLEIFTAGYSNIPEHLHHFEYLYFGLEGHSTLVPWMWTGGVFAILALVILLVPKLRLNESLLTVACLAVFASIWIEKGLGMVVTGFVPSTLGHITEYSPTLPEVLITLSIYATGVLILTVLYKVAVTVRAREPEAAWAEETAAPAEPVAAGD